MVGSRCKDKKSDFFCLLKVRIDQAESQVGGVGSGGVAPHLLPPLLLLQVALHLPDGQEGERGAGHVQEGGDEAEQGHGGVAPAHVAVHPGVAVARVDGGAAPAHVRGVDGDNEVQVEPHRHHVGRGARRLERQLPHQQLPRHAVGGLVPGDHEQQRHHAEDQAPGHAPVDARRPHLAVLHVQVAGLLQLRALQVEVGVDVEAAHAAHGGQARHHHLRGDHADQDQGVGQDGAHQHDAWRGEEGLDAGLFRKTRETEFSCENTSC